MYPLHSHSALLLLACAIAVAASTRTVFTPHTSSLDTVRPVVFYHGMGDSAHSKGMEELFDSLRAFAPEIFIHSVSLAESEAEDQRAGFFGNVNHQIETVCEQLKGIPELSKGFNAVGFSQGGQFLRAYIQRCNDPPVHNLVTVGSQHGGVSDIPGCVQADASCRLMRTIARSGVYSGYVRDHIVQAQYYKDPKNLATYLSRNIFLPDINNELALKNTTYVRHLTSINKLAMFMFMEDITVKPKETAWFGFQDENGDIIELEEQDQYKENWLGLKTMDRAGKLSFELFQGEHMRFSVDEFIDNIAIPYIFELETVEEGKKRKQKNMERYRQIQKEQQQRQQSGMNDQTNILNRFNDLDQTLQTTLG
ncbi:palmitoyl-protein thioesterase [Entomortierella parvispora]|uniref:Palmitoyl-protein thioesterase 1 n=1 Tax=Entomortierella parvispora TaxID=205924 RepID=A0A9P3LTI1_9FUNG|nr:palmitoyl-protein thioesterase [Entomortierella parvispora]